MCFRFVHLSVEYSIRAPMCLETSRLEVEVLETMGGKVRGGGCTYVVQKSQTYWYCRKNNQYKRSIKRNGLQACKKLDIFKLMQYHYSS